MNQYNNCKGWRWGQWEGEFSKCLFEGMICVIAIDVIVGDMMCFLWSGVEWCGVVFIQIQIKLLIT